MNLLKDMNVPTRPLPLYEFVAILTLMITTVALAIDIMLPALKVIGDDLNVANLNDTQLIISVMFIGFAIGQFLVGPLSDAYGRKPIICVGYIVLFIGCVISIYSDTMAMMLFGRFLQGVGAAAPRVLTTSLIRDLYSGREMGKIMSIILAFFILVPVVAPLIGQVIINLLSWVYIFVFIIVFGLLGMVWLILRQPETCTAEKRRPLSMANLKSDLMAVIKAPGVVSYTMALGLVSGAFIAYLGTARQIFQDIYLTGDAFVIYFGLTALSIGASSFFNAALLKQFEMRPIIMVSMIWIAVVCAIFGVIFQAVDGVPSLPLFIFWLVLVFFGMGLIYANLTSLAMQPLGNVAGMGAAFIGAVSTALSVPLGYIIGQMFDLTVMPLVISYAVLATMSYLTINFATPKQQITSD